MLKISSSSDSGTTTKKTPEGFCPPIPEYEISTVGKYFSKYDLLIPTPSLTTPSIAVSFKASTSPASKIFERSINVALSFASCVAWYDF